MTGRFIAQSEVRPGYRETVRALAEAQKAGDAGDPRLLDPG